MVRQFVNNHMSDKFAQPDIAAFNPFFENRHPEQVYAVGRLCLVKYGFFSQRLPVIYSGERVRAFELKAFDNSVVGQFGNGDSYSSGNRSVWFRQSSEGKPNQLRNVIAGRRSRVVIRVRHG